MFKFMRKGNRGVGKNCMSESPLEIAPKDTYQVMKKSRHIYSNDMRHIFIRGNFRSKNDTTTMHIFVTNQSQ